MKNNESKESPSIQIPPNVPALQVTAALTPYPKSEPIDIPSMDQAPKAKPKPVAYSYNKQKMPPEQARHLDLLALPRQAPLTRAQPFTDLTNLSLFNKPNIKQGLKLVIIQDDDMMFPIEILVRR